MTFGPRLILTPVQLAKMIVEEAQIPLLKPGIYFDHLVTEEYAFVRSPLPYGPWVDDGNRPVVHYLLWSSRDIYDPAQWVDEEFEEIKRDGVCGFVGFPEPPTTELCEDFRGYK